MKKDSQIVPVLLKLKRMLVYIVHVSEMLKSCLQPDYIPDCYPAVRLWTTVLYKVVEKKNRTEMLLHFTRGKDNRC